MPMLVCSIPMDRCAIGRNEIVDVRASVRYPRPPIGGSSSLSWEFCDQSNIGSSNASVKIS